ncbi:hypothetical protein BB560_005692 [Smittium megazygosporum]|uniref:Uncharacterized protein n=1 Tax=Smittium megazygosporum TaxID=133381 RepID=A0A2T9Z150_9FUNG|nr:hypothetical protein BB560_005692 [Smittium megazygosporum]
MQKRYLVFDSDLVNAVPNARASRVNGEIFVNKRNIKTVKYDATTTDLNPSSKEFRLSLTPSFKKARSSYLPSAQLENWNNIQQKHLDTDKRNTVFKYTRYNLINSDSIQEKKALDENNIVCALQSNSNLGSQCNLKPMNILSNPIKRLQEFSFKDYYQNSENTGFSVRKPDHRRRQNKEYILSHNLASSDDSSFSDDENIYSRQLSSFCGMYSTPKNISSGFLCDNISPIENTFGSRQELQDIYRKKSSSFKKVCTQNQTSHRESSIDLSIEDENRDFSFSNPCTEAEIHFANSETLSFYPEQHDLKILENTEFGQKYGEWRYDFEIGESDLKSGDMELVALVDSPLSLDHSLQVLH